MAGGCEGEQTGTARADGVEVIEARVDLLEDGLVAQ